MVLTMEQQQVRDLLTETVTLLCKNGLKFSHELGIEGLIGITLDKEEVFLVSIKETILSDRKVFHNSSAIPDHIEEAVEFSPVLETFLGEESFKSTQQCGRVDRKNQKNCGVEIDSGTVSATNSDTHKSSSGTTRSEFVFEDIEDATKILACNYEMPRKRHRVKGNSRTVAGEEKSNFSISSDHKKQSTAAFINENNNCDESQMSSDSCVIEIKREAINENEDDENSYMAVGSLYPNSFDNFNVWNWKPSDEKPKQMLEKMSSEKHFVQYNSSSSSTSTWNARSQKSRTRHPYARTVADVRPDVRPDDSDARRCPVCGTVSLNWNMYLRHIRKHQPGMYRCPFCGKSFSGSTNLRGHLAVHTNIREFACHLCEKTYAYKKDLSEHLVLKHSHMQSQLDRLVNFSPNATNHGIEITELLGEENI